jgi:hypothetical protein
MQKIMGMNAFAFSLRMDDGQVHHVYVLNAQTRDEAIAHMRKMMTVGKGAIFFQVHKSEMLNVSMARVVHAAPH